MKSHKPRLKVLAFFIHRYRWGEQIRGDERGFLEKVKQFKKMGITVYVFELVPSLQECRGELIYESLKIRLKLKRRRNPLEQTVILLRLILATLRLASKIPFDVIYAYNQDIENVVPAYILKLILRRPLVIVFHLLRPKDVASFKVSLSSRLRRGFKFISALLASLLDIVKKLAYLKADLYISVSDAVKEDLVKYLGIQKEILVARNGVNTTEFMMLNLEKVYDAIFHGRLHPQKGIETLLRAWKIVVSRVSSAKLVLVGGGEKDHVARYRSLIRELGLEENVEMTGFVSDGELIRLLNSSKVFVFPSKYDGFAQSVAEAMACGLPCVISNIPALRENYGEAAVLVEPKDVEGFADTILQLLKDRKRREKLGGSARECVKKFDWEDVAKRELEAILSLLRES